MVGIMYCRLLHEVVPCSGLVVWGLLACCHFALPSNELLRDIPFVRILKKLYLSVGQLPVCSAQTKPCRQQLNWCREVQESRVRKPQKWWTHRKAGVCKSTWKLGDIMWLGCTGTHGSWNSWGAQIHISAGRLDTAEVRRNTQELEGWIQLGCRGTHGS